MPSRLCPGSSSCSASVCISTPALQAFRDQFGGNPSLSSATADSEKLLRLREEVAAKYGISTDIITEEFSKYETSWTGAKTVLTYL